MFVINLLNTDSLLLLVHKPLYVLRVVLQMCLIRFENIFALY